ncbi:Uncharacterized protein OBRU01_19118, partial [Operophtera brumata]
MQDNLVEEFTTSQIFHALTILKNHITSDFLNFEEYEGITPLEFHTWTSITRQQFSSLLENVSSLNNRRNKKTILAAVLTKMRTGDSNARLASIFKTSESTFQRMLNEGREALLVDYVPSRLGYDHMSREEVYRNLLKPMLYVCCDGHIIEVSGPHAATTSDAVIMNNTIDDEEGLIHWFYRPGDVFILDRGFRDSKGPLEDYGYAVHMPETKHPRETQLTTDQANKSRCVTICRWVVEVINGRFKRDFRLLRIDHSNRALSYMMDYFRIAAALLNDFHVLIDNNVHANEFLNIINERISQPNRLADLVIRNNYNRRRAHFQPMAANMPEFE